ncbi:MAG: ATPase, partial [Bacteroidetes bacterium HGW-Bacteroidetes-15]
MPSATTGGISFIDAIFTSTSAVCVTGLIVVDTSTAFTLFGKSIILGLIQLGGLGVMTFTTFFGMFFRGNTSFQSQLYMRDMVNETNISEVFKTILKIVLFTFLVEIIGAYFIFVSLDGDLIYKLKTSWFHSISSFCNAGFSTFSNGLMEGNLKTNYLLHLTVAILVISGGLGFPVIFNFYLLIKHRIKNIIKSIFTRQWKNHHRPHIINAGSRLVVITTFSLLTAGFLLFLLTEWSGSLAAHPWYGKLVTAFFGSVTPRTAGFNTVDYSTLGHATILFTLVLMWIGASPGSTGGGIKTSTFAVAILNLLSVVRGKEHVEYYNVELSSVTIRRAFSIITLSVLVIGGSTFLIKVFD